MECRPTACIEKRCGSSAGSIGRFGQLDGFRLGNRADQNKSHAKVSAQLCQRPAKILWPPGFHDIAGSDLYGDPLADGPVLRPKKHVGPGSTIGWNGDR